MSSLVPGLGLWYGARRPKMGNSVQNKSVVVEYNSVVVRCWSAAVISHTLLFINIWEWDSLTAPCLYTAMYTVYGRCGQYGRCMFIYWPVRQVRPVCGLYGPSVDYTKFARTVATLHLPCAGGGAWTDISDFSPIWQMSQQMTPPAQFSHQLNCLPPNIAQSRSIEYRNIRLSEGQVTDFTLIRFEFMLVS